MHYRLSEFCEKNVIEDENTLYAHEVQIGMSTELTLSSFFVTFSRKHEFSLWSHGVNPLSDYDS